MIDSPPPSRPSVLLVDDDPHLRAVLSFGLPTQGFDVVSAGTAEEALRISNDPSVRIDVIVMDLSLPDSWGAQVAVEQSRLRPDVEVIFISGYGAGDPIFEANVSTDEVHFLAKPFTAKELGDFIREVLGRR